MVNDSGVEVGITLAAACTSLPGGVRWLVLDDPRSAAGTAAHSDGAVTDADRPRALQIQDAAYVVYTSGSTGAPKGSWSRTKGWRVSRPSSVIVIGWTAHRECCK